MASLKKTFALWTTETSWNMLRPMPWICDTVIYLQQCHTSQLSCCLQWQKYNLARASLSMWLFYTLIKIMYSRKLWVNRIKLEEKYARDQHGVICLSFSLLFQGTMLPGKHSGLGLSGILKKKKIKYNWKKMSACFCKHSLELQLNQGCNTESSNNTFYALVLRYVYT